ncbi:LOW QUALITY PROTEIN: FecR family protein [Zymomonas mobilis]|nr:LOW QUALITY PROTEIN: FecR family protein [Zymomonas mobilis]
MFWKRGSLRPFLLGCALLFLGSGHSEKAVAAHFENHQSVEYIVEQGDTLSSIAQRYFDRISDMEAIAKRAGVSLSQPLHTGFHLNIPKAFLRREISTAVVSHISGPVTLFIHGKRGCLQQGQPVTEQMTIETGSSGFVTLLLPDGSHVSMPSMSQITITRLRKVALTGAVERSFKLEAGHVRVHAAPLFRSDSYFHIATPSSLTAVRGTDFRVHYIENSKTHKKENIVEVLEGLVTTDNHKIVYAVPGGYGTNSIEKLDFPLNTPPNPSNRLTILRDAEPDIFLSKMPTASVYHAELSKDPDFSDLLSESWLDNTDVKLQGLGDGHYYLRLSAVDNHDLEGEEKVFPIDHKTGHLEASAYSFSEGAVFQWKIPDNEVVISRLQVVASKISETAIPIVDQLGGKTGLVKISSLPEGDYSWRIIAAWPAGGQIILPFRKLHISGNNPMKKNE